MTPDERDILRLWGQNILYNLCDGTPILLLEGMFIVLFCITAHITIKRGLASHLKRVLLAISIFTFLTACTFCALTVANTYMIIQTLVAYPGIPLSDRQDLAHRRMQKLDAPLSWIWGLLPFVTDLVAILRGTTLFPEQRKGFMLALCCCLSGAVIMLVELAMNIHNVDPTILFTLDATSVTLSFGTNLIATALCAYGVWSYRSFLVGQLHLEDRQQFRLYKVLRLLVESGSVYCAMQAIIVAFTFLPFAESLSPMDFVVRTLCDVYAMASAIYPSLITLLVKQRINFVETYEHCSTEGDATPD